MVNSSVGRPRGGGQARQRLLDAAVAGFMRDGYQATSTRSVAREAGVSHSLVNYHFGSKEGLFASALAIRLRPSLLVDAALSAPVNATPHERAVHLVRTLLSVWENPTLREPVVTALRQAGGDDEMRAAVAGFLGEEIFTTIADHLGGTDARIRMAGVVSTVVGTIFARYVMEAEPLASLPADDVVRALAPMLAVHLR